MKELVVNKETLTSLELVEQINIFRRQEGNRAELQHKTLLEIIRDEFSEEIGEQKILPSSYKNSQNKSQPMFILSLNQSKQILMRESKFVRKAMIHYIEELEKALKEISDKDKLLLGLFSKNPMTVAESHKQLVALELKPLQEKIEEQKPKVIFASAVETSKTSILIGEMAKILKQNGIDIGQNKLFAWLRDNGYLIKRKGSDYNMPTQKSMELGLFEIKETVITHSSGDIKINKTTKITGKGQIYLLNKFKRLQNAE